MTIYEKGEHALATLDKLTQPRFNDQKSELELPFNEELNPQYFNWNIIKHFIIKLIKSNNYNF